VALVDAPSNAVSRRGHGSVRLRIDELQPAAAPLARTRARFF